jgi:hypothetical protein
VAAGVDLETFPDTELGFALVSVEEAADGGTFLLAVEAIVETDALEGLHTLLGSLGGGLVEDGPCTLLVFVLVLDLLNLADKQLLRIVEVGLPPSFPFYLFLHQLLLLREVLGDGLTLGLLPLDLFVFAALDLPLLGLHFKALLLPIFGPLLLLLP